MLITPEMVAQVRERIARERGNVPVVLIEEERPRLSERARRQMERKSLKFALPAGPLTVILEDDLMHTIAFPVCADPACICQSLEREQIIAETTPRKRRRRQILVDTNCEAALNAPLGGNRGFNLLK